MNSGNGPLADEGARRDGWEREQVEQRRTARRRRPHAYAYGVPPGILGTNVRMHRRQGRAAHRRASTLLTEPAGYRHIGGRRREGDGGPAPAPKTKLEGGIVGSSMTGWWDPGKVRVGGPPADGTVDGDILCL